MAMNRTNGTIYKHSLYVSMQGSTAKLFTDLLHRESTVHQELFVRGMPSGDCYIRTTEIESTATRYEVLSGHLRHTLIVFQTRAAISHYRQRRQGGRPYRFGRHHKAESFSRHGTVSFILPKTLWLTHPQVFSDM
jgi:hypothetical protein